MKILDIKNLSRNYGKNLLNQSEKYVNVLDKISFHVEKGEFLGIMGKSGCGKTTLLNMIGCLEKPDSGSIIVDGVDIWGNKNKRELFSDKLGFLFQNFALLEGRTVAQNLQIIQKKSRTETSIEEALAAVGLTKKMNTKVYKLSGGEQQRVALARLMLKKCDVILADEPTGSLDEENADMVMNILHLLNQTGKTVVLVTHSEKIIKSESRVIKL